LALESVQQMGLSVWHSCGIVNQGVRCWGNNSFGQLGDGSTVDRILSVSAHGLTQGVALIASGRYHTCAVQNNAGVADQVRCWGRNRSGQLGDGTTTDRYVPTAVAGLTEEILAIQTKEAHTCVITASRRVK
jgi:alpha-tubulin suppressor-like RCC1 family protein